MQRRQFIKHLKLEIVPPPRERDVFRSSENDYFVSRSFLTRKKAASPNIRAAATIRTILSMDFLTFSPSSQQQNIFSGDQRMALMMTMVTMMMTTMMMVTMMMVTMIVVTMMIMTSMIRLQVIGG